MRGTSAIVTTLPRSQGRKQSDRLSFALGDFVHA
jgi:hypothetical protein